MTTFYDFLEMSLNNWTLLIGYEWSRKKGFIKFNGMSFLYEYQTQLEY